MVLINQINIQFYKTKVAEFILGSFDGKLCLLDFRYRRMRGTIDKRLQKGLDPADKSVKVANFCKNLIHEVEVISHSCGVGRPRLLKRKHVRIMQSDGTSVPMDERYPYKDILPEYLPKTAAE